MDRREALEAAFDKLEDDTPEEVGHAPVEESTETLERKGEPESAAKEGAPLEVGKGTKVGGKEPNEGALGEPQKDKEKGGEKDGALERAATASADGAVTGKPPVSWKVGAKEQWAKLPVDIRNEVTRREKEISQYISQNDHHRKFNEAFNHVVGPFAHLIQAQRSTPLQAVRNLLTTSAGLVTGNAGQKAQIVAEIIQNYGVDIETLDKVLSGGQVAQRQQETPNQIHPSVLQALQPVYGFMNEVQQARQARVERQQQEAERLVEESSELPYFDDLRDEMADLMEIAAKRGLEMNIKQAYEKAVALNPEISQVISRQKAAEEAKRNGGTRLAKARRVASTLTGAPAGTPGGSGAPKNRREQLEAAWDEAGSN